MVGLENNQLISERNNMSEHDTPIEASTDVKPSHQAFMDDINLGMNRFFAEVDRELSTLRSEIETLTAERNTLAQTSERELSALRSDIDVLTAERNTLAQTGDRELSALRSEVEVLTSERNALAQTIDGIATSLKGVGISITPPPSEGN